jgi:hypothetical protein
MKLESFTDDVGHGGHGAPEVSTSDAKSPSVEANADCSRQNCGHSDGSALDEQTARPPTPHVGLPGDCLVASGCLS